jgi:hypothetical protein
MFVPVVDISQKPLMPTTPARARKWIKSRKATGFWKRGVYCVRLNVEPSARNVQETVVGIDPGSKREGLTVKSGLPTYLNIQATAVDWVKDAVKARRNARRARRFRNTPCRQNRKNRTKGSLPPSTKARWQWKLRLVKWFCKIFPISHFVVEDIKATTRKGKRRFNKSFSPLEVGKKWFYSSLEKIAPVTLKQGWETWEMRLAAGLKKTKEKLAETFSAHCVDSWVLANSWVGGHTKPDNEAMLLVTPLRFHRRQLHVFQPAAGGIRKLYGGTRSLGFKRGSLIIHPKQGLCYVGGTSGDRISLHDVSTGKRLGQRFKPEDCTFLSFNSWRTRLLPA